MICTFTTPLSLIAKVSPFFEIFTIKNYYDTKLIKEAHGAHMQPYGYMYHTPSRDGALHGCNHLFGVHDPYGIHNTWLSLFSLGMSSFEMATLKTFHVASHTGPVTPSFQGGELLGGYRCCSSG